MSDQDLVELRIRTDRINMLAVMALIEMGYQQDVVQGAEGSAADCLKQLVLGLNNAWPAIERAELTDELQEHGGHPASWVDVEMESVDGRQDDEDDEDGTPIVIPDGGEEYYLVNGRTDTVVVGPVDGTMAECYVRVFSPDYVVTRRRTLERVGQNGTDLSVVPGVRGLDLDALGVGTDGS